MRSCSKIGCEIRWRLSVRFRISSLRCWRRGAVSFRSSRRRPIVSTASFARRSVPMRSGFYAGICDRLVPATRARLEALLRPDSDAEVGSDGDGEPIGSPRHCFCGCAAIRAGRAWPASRTSWPSWSWSAGSDCRPTCSTRCFPTNWSGIDGASRSRPPTSCAGTRKRRRLTWLAAFVHLRGRQLTDNLVDLLIETIHHIGARAERRVDRELLDDLKRVTGKQNLLFELAGAALDQPDGDRARCRVPGRRRTDLA